MSRMLHHFACLTNVADVSAEELLEYRFPLMTFQQSLQPA
jgi:hypothetical protein